MQFATISGGESNIVAGSYATIPGGATNLATGAFSFAAGDEAQATNGGAFVWADAEGTPFASTTTNQFNVRANGGVVFVTGGAGMTIDGQPVVAGSVSAAQLTGTSGNSFIIGGGSTIGSDNTANGFFALVSNTSGSFNMANGAYALAANIIGSANTADGSLALFKNTSGSNNIALGYQAGFNITTGSSNIDIGNLGLSTDTNIIRIGTGRARRSSRGHQRQRWRLDQSQCLSIEQHRE